MKLSRCTIVIPSQAILVLLFALTSVFASCTNIRAQGNEREIRAAKERIQHILERAEELERVGRREAGQELRREAGQLKDRLAKSRARNSKEISLEGSKKILHGLEQGMEALKKLGMRQDAAHLAEIAQGLRNRLEHSNARKEGRKDKEGEKRRERRGGREREVAMHHLQILRYAKGAFAEAGKKDLLHMIETAIHARELALEGKRNEKAQHVMKSAPSRVNLAELLIHAAGILKEYRATEKAGAVRELANHLLEGIKRERRGNRRQERDGRERRGERRQEREGRRERRGERRQEREGRERRDERRQEREGRERREHDKRAGDTKRHIEELEEQLEELRQALRELRKSLGGTRRRR